jgi:ppGpp synthetase/RelA/SpoT-type nucleotidyltranferase
MSGLSALAQRFLDVYPSELTAARRAAELARHLVESAAKETGLALHVVDARAKSIDSLRGKLRRKNYRRPAQQITDIIGVRVITYYRDAVDPIVARLRTAFEINQKASTDKRLALGLHDFGYRSVHLIARLKPNQIFTRDHRPLRRRWFEIQVRSILEHAWAEIEHEIVYKSGIKQPVPIIRRFAALAGSLELLDGEFLALREERDRLIDEYVVKYKNNQDQRRVFDVARLLAFLESQRPEGRSWRQAVAAGRPFAAGLEVSCVDALKTVGLGTPASLGQMFKSGRFRYAVRSFATAKGLAPAEISHLAEVVLAVMAKNVHVVQRHFPEMMYDPAIRLIVERRAGQ